MRWATKEETCMIKNYIRKISFKTGVNFWDVLEKGGAVLDNFDREKFKKEFMENFSIKDILDSLDFEEYEDMPGVEFAKQNGKRVVIRNKVGKNNYTYLFSDTDDEQEALKKFMKDMEDDANDVIFGLDDL